MSRINLLGLLLVLTSLAVAGGARAACPVQPAPGATQDFEGFKGRIFELGGETMPYRLFVPPDYDAAKAYPLVLYLHHAGLAGTDNCIQLTEEAGSGGYGGVFVHEGVALDGSKFDTQTKYPHILVAPQAPTSNYGFGGGVVGSATADEHSTRPLVYGILEAVRAEFNVDARRIYVTGISMGCYGAWDMIMRRPDYFAAASPHSCRGDPNESLLQKLVEMPIWSMCGTNDSYFMGAQAMADAMENVGAKKFIFTPFQGVGHSIHSRGYDYPGFIDWMFAQSLPAPVVDPNGGAGGSGGAGGLAGATSGGVSGGGAGGMAGSGAASGGAPAAGSAPVPTGGNPSGVGGIAASAGTASSASPAVDSESEGCSCSLPSRTRTPAWGLFALLVPLASRRRRLGLVLGRHR